MAHTPETEIRNLFRQAAIFAGMGVFWLAVGLTTAISYTMRHNLHGVDQVYDGSPYELFFASAYYLMSSFLIGFAVYRFGQACICLADNKELG
jgi:hypothetical protein